jgi:hypothetical protein
MISTSYLKVLKKVLMVATHAFFKAIYLRQNRPLNPMETNTTCSGTYLEASVIVWYNELHPAR